MTNALGSAFAAEGCERPAVSPIVLERACGGSRVIATAALTTGEDDVLVFAPEAPPEPPKAPGGKGTKAAPPAPKTPKPRSEQRPAPKPPGATTTP